MSPTAMFEVFDVSAVRFGEPVWLPLLAAPVLLLVLWAWRLAERRRDRRAYARRRISRSISVFGDLASWGLVVLALATTLLALARPLVVTSTVRTAGIDLVILQDGSASMRVPDVPARAAGAGPGDRWRRSMQFLRVLGESLRWEDDRIALALFATMATPQIRLTRDPNTFFFFLDNLEDEPPFRLQDAGTWDTNIERGIYWGLRLIDKDRELHGPTANARAFVLISDGQAWSGEVEQSLALARAGRIPVHVIGVGTTAGGVIPEPQRASTDAPVASRLDRNSLAAIATAGGGRYFELDRATDQEIANAIIAATRRQAAQTSVAETTEDLYPRLLLAAAGLLLVAALLS
ncbi:MAG: vWA domain-containing protein [Vicinamibacterales bacterium]